MLDMHLFTATAYDLHSLRPIDYAGKNIAVKRKHDMSLRKQKPPPRGRQTSNTCMQIGLQASQLPATCIPMAGLTEFTKKMKDEDRDTLYRAP
uniref:Uncharacterized protein n=1 Tax=Anopheles minimus TaxID=112268 RepID=A0A182WN59_9DIPT